MNKTGIARRIKELREERFQENEKKCATFLGIKYTTYRDYESGRSSKVDVLEKIALKFGVSLDWLILGRGAKYVEGGVAAESPGTYGQLEPMDRFWVELGRIFEELKPASDREVLRQHLFMILRPHIDPDHLWKRFKTIRAELDRKPDGQ